MLTIKERLELTAIVKMLERLERSLVRKRRVRTSLADKAKTAADAEAQLEADCYEVRERIKELREKEAETAVV